MRVKLQELLYARYPGLYGAKDNPATQSAVGLDFSHDDGWFSIVDALSQVLTNLDHEVRATQVKEKFGSLRFYVETASSVSFGAIRAAESFSDRICEETGRPGELVSDGGWYRTLSPEASAALEGKEQRLQKIVPRDYDGDEWPKQLPELAVRRTFSKAQAIESLRVCHPKALADTREIDFPPRLLDLVEVAVCNISRAKSGLPDAQVVKVDEIYWTAEEGLVIVPAFGSMRSVALDELDADRRQAEKFGREFEDTPIGLLVERIADEIEGVAHFVNEMSKRMEIQSGRCGPVNDEGVIADLLPPDPDDLVDPLESSKQVFTVLRSFEPDELFQLRVFPRRRIKAALKARRVLANLIREETIGVVLPKIYSQRNFFTPDGMLPSPWRVVNALAEQYRWRVVLPIEMSRFLMGLSSRPTVCDLKTFYYDQPEEKHFAELKLTLKPVIDRRLLGLNVGGQVIWHFLHEHPDVTDGELLKAARFAGSAWFSDSQMLRWLVKEADRGALEGRELFLAEAIITAVRENEGLASEAPADFDPSQHEAEATRVYGWWFQEDKDGSKYLAAHRIENHPHICDGDSLAHSTALVWCDEKLGWARTRSRYYRLMGDRFQ